MSTADFYDTLQRIESVHLTVESANERLHRYVVGQVVAGVVLVVAAASVVAAGAPAAGAAAVGLLALGGGAVIAIGTSRLLIRPVRTQARRDEAMVVEAANMLREILPHLARREQWGPVSYRLAETRIARFQFFLEDR
ncbi:hypothetical protein F4553_008052 [Allocatelliglobosispora scoriae]|uniref:DUF4231 domain-containing protein n=2 Tax=Allocatelliglobosispora scoriae TaxID=643052 RepID=A0A841C4A9_9ACTN|nr:hypothetical protein [Allocatelliglobosispora scoriae]